MNAHLLICSEFANVIDANNNTIATWHPDDGYLFNPCLYELNATASVDDCQEQVRKHLVQLPCSLKELQGVNGLEPS